MKALLDKIHQLNVAVIGDVILDHYILGDTSRISPEAPVPVVNVSKDIHKAGGAANVALNIKSLGAEVELCGWLGHDEAGDQMRQILEDSGVHFDTWFVNHDVPTIKKTRVMVRNQQLCRVDREGYPDLYSMAEPAMIDFLKQHIAGKNAVILSDYAKGVIDQPLADELIRFCNDKGIFVAKDPKPRRELTLVGMDLFTPNRLEAIQLSGVEVVPGRPFPAEEICKRIWEKYAPKFLVITLGSEGMLLSEQGSKPELIPTYAREVYDVSGAGDTVIAALTLALASGVTMKEAAHFANTAAGVVVGKVGTATATPEEVLGYHP